MQEKSSKSYTLPSASGTSQCLTMHKEAAGLQMTVASLSEHCCQVVTHWSYIDVLPASYKRGGEDRQTCPALLRHGAGLDSDSKAPGPQRVQYVQRLMVLIKHAEHPWTRNS